MKYLLTVIILFFNTQIYSQNFALIDGNVKMPILYTDSVSVEQVKMGYFPVEKNKIDTFLANMQFLVKLLTESKKGTRTKMESFQLRNGTTQIDISRVPFAYGDRYNITAKTN